MMEGQVPVSHSEYVRLVRESNRVPGLEQRIEELVREANSVKVTPKQVENAIRKYAHDDSCYIFEVYGEMCEAIADELNSELGSRTCRIIESVTDGLCSGHPRKWFRLSCGHSFTLEGLETPVACAVCGKTVKQ